MGRFGNTRIVSASFTRPNNTTAYAALDVVANATSNATIITFSDAVTSFPANGGYITKARFFTDQKGNVARFRLHLFHTAPTMIVDNSPYLLLYANRDKKIGYIDFAACATEDPTNSTAAASLNATVRLPFTTARDDNDIYGILETLDAFTPAAEQNFWIELTIDND